MRVVRLASRQTVSKAKVIKAAEIAIEHRRDENGGNSLQRGVMGVLTGLTRTLSR